MKTLTVQGITTVGGLTVSFSKGNDPQVFAFSYPTKAAVKSVVQELDETLEHSLLLMLIALYVRQSGDTNLVNAENLIGKTITLDLTKVGAALVFA
jgi:hypothetical protein